MYSVQRLVGIALVFAAAWAGWVVLGAVTIVRAGAQESRLASQVAELWGAPQVQTAPALTFRWKEKRSVEKTNVVKDEVTTTTEIVEDDKICVVSLASTRVAADLRLDERRKGLLWYPLYGVDFDGRWTYVHSEPVSGTLDVTFRFPDPNGLYDDFHLVVGDTDWSRSVQPQNGVVSVAIDVKPGETVSIQVAYRSRGLESWRYSPGAEVARLSDFQLLMQTDFRAIDFPPLTMAPSEKLETPDGWQLTWRFEQVITGFQIGMLMPSRIQPGELASALAFSAPISLLFFFLFLFTLSVLRGVELHPVNYLFLAGAFVAFHLLFAYTADRLPVAPAFALASVVSLFLTVSYLRLVVGPRFAFFEAGAAQVVYLIGFALAHFFEGVTGLAVTVLSIVTLFLLMQLTAKLRWAEVIGRPHPTAS
jgi:inner membrane protein involved in colicin E2 resistance